MKFTTKQNTPVTVNLLSLVNDNGWTLDGSKAIHDSCNAGTIILNDSFTQNVEYAISIEITAISGGVLTVALGEVSTTFTTTGIKRFSLKSITTTNPKLSLYSNANLTIVKLVTKKVETVEDLDPNKKDAILYSSVLKKWVSFLNYYPDTGFSLFTNLYTLKDGQLYSHTDNTNRNRFYGQNYKSRVNIPMVSPESKTFTNINIHSNKLLVTTEDGVVTSLGQISNLIPIDFEKQLLVDGLTTVRVYGEDGIYRANFQRAKPDIANGDRLKGEYITVELTTNTDQNFKLYRVQLDYIVNTPYK